MPTIKHNLTKPQARKKRVRGKIDLSKRPRVSVFRSNKHIYLQVIKDGTVIASSSDKVLTAKDIKGKTKTEKAVLAAKKLATDLQKAKVTAVVFDRGQYKYHGRLKAVAETLREAGVEV